MIPRQLFQEDIVELSKGFFNGGGGQWTEEVSL